MGGNCIKWVAGGGVSQGNALYISTSNGKIYKNGVGNNTCVGFAFADASVDEDVYIITSGLCYVKPISTVTLSKGYSMIVATGMAQDGLVNQTNNISSTTYTQVLGHILEDGTSPGALALAIFQPN